MMLFRFLVTLFLVTFAGNTASAQTCESLFNTSVLSGFTMEDQETLTTLARRQVEISSNFSISTTQKQNVLKHLDEQVEEFIASSQLNTTQEKILKQEYRSLVFQFNRELSGELDVQANKVSAKENYIKKQNEEQHKYIKLEELFKKYSDTEPIQVLRTLIGRRFDSENEKEFRFVLNYLPDVNATIFGKTLLEFAISEQNVGMTKILLETKDIHIETQPGHEPPLHLAIQSGTTEIAQLLITKGANVNAKDKNGKAPIHWAIEKPEFLDMLLQVPTLDINAIGSADKTPLQWALYQLSLHHVNHPNDHSITSQINSTVKKLLLMPNIDINSETRIDPPFEIAIKSGNFEAVKLLMSHPSFKINSRNHFNQTPLHLAIRNTEVLNILLDRGADINAKDNNQDTPLHRAVSNKDFTSAIEILIERGANINTVDWRGDTPFDSAIRWDTIHNQYQRVRTLLKAKNIDLNLKGRDGRTVEESLLQIRQHIEPELKEFYRSRGLAK